MSEAEFVKVKYRLTEQVARPGGMTAGLANERAQRELANLAARLDNGGGVAPAGSWRSMVCTTEVTWASAVWIFAPGWKKTLMTATPASDCDSMCSMSLTVVVSTRSLMAVTRCPISCADRPL